MSKSLHDKIKELLEAKATDLQEGASEAAVALKQAAHGLEQAADALAESDDASQDDDQEDDDSNTAVGADKATVKEDKDPFGSLDDQGSEEAGATKTGKLKSGLGKKDPAPGKLEAPPQTGATDDAGKNAKLEVGKDKKESGGELPAGPTGKGGDEPTNAKSVAGTELQKGSKKGVVEHMDALFSGEDLTEEFKTKAQTIFEAAVEAAASDRLAALEEEYQQRIDEDAKIMSEAIESAVAKITENFENDIDGFLSAVTENWVKENSVALEGAIKVEMVNSFIDGMKNLFKEHYFDIPEDKLDIVEEQAKEISELRAVLSDLNEEHMKLVSESADLRKTAIQEVVAEELTAVQKEKFTSLVENVEFTSEEEYIDKLVTIKESYFPNVSKGSVIPKDDAPANLAEDTKKPVDSYVAALAEKIR